MLATLEHLERNNPYAIANKAHVYASQREWDKAIKQIDLALDIDENEIEFHLAKIKYLFETGQVNKAMMAKQTAEGRVTDKRHSRSLSGLVDKYSVLSAP